jgi:hypothetical protein
MAQDLENIKWGMIPGIHAELPIHDLRGLDQKIKSLTYLGNLFNITVFSEGR